MSRSVFSKRAVSGISASEFLDVYNSVWTNKSYVINKELSGTPTSHCIAVSGGSDSMALAFLLHRLSINQFHKKGWRIQLSALVVDHQLRKNSGVGAQKTMERLRTMGIFATILKLDWPTEVSPSKLPYFETKARRLRYQALGRACVQHSQQDLVLGHHADDQAETILMDLAASQSATTIRTIPLWGPMPECEGIHGVDHSGQFERNVQRLSRLQLSDKSDMFPMKIAHLQKAVQFPPLFETGGPNLIRPLLGFSKERLLQTCKDNSVEWEEDESNHDVRVTLRNTARSLLSNARLPKALQTSSLLRIADRRSSRLGHLIQLASLMLEGCEILLLDVRSGVLTVRLPSLLLPHAPSRHFARAVATKVLQRIAWTVTPREKASLARFPTAVSIFFPDLQDPHAHKTVNGDKVSSFTAGGVQFVRQHKRATQMDPMHLSNQHKYLISFGQLDPEFVWVLSRQPFSDTTRPKPVFFSPEQKAISQSWSAWHLWDDRYWFRVRHTATRNFILRTWREDELPAIRAKMAPCAYDRFRDALRDAAPGKIRWTLPVIAEIRNNADQDEYDRTSSGVDLAVRAKDVSCGEDLTGSIILFPTLGKAGWLDVVDQDGGRKLEWEVRYKNVALRRRMSQDSQVFGHDPRYIKAWDDGGQGEQTKVPMGWTGPS